MEILDMKCAQTGKEIADIVFDKLHDKNKTENLITKSLGVLQEDGVYAFFLWCASKAEKIKETGFAFLKQEGIIVENGNEPLQAIRDTFKDNLDRLLFAKELLERTLVYARYHAKALLPVSEEAPGESS